MVFSRLFSWRRLVFWLLLAHLGFSCDLQPPPSSGEPALLPFSPDLSGVERRRRLWRGGARKLLVVYGDQPASLAPRYRRLLDDLRWRSRVVSGKGASQVGVSPPSGGSLLLLGTFRSNPALKAMIRDLPVEDLGNGFRFLDAAYREDDQILELLLPRPGEPEELLWIILGNSDRALLEHPFRLPCSYDFQIWQRGKRIRFGRFDLPGTPPTWRTTLDRRLDRSLPLKLGTSSFHFFVQEGVFDSSQFKEFAERREDVRRRVLEFLQVSAQGADPINYFLYSRLSEKAEFTDDQRLAHARPEFREVHRTYQSGLQEESWDPEVLVLLRDFLGKPRHQALELGLSILLSDTWRSEGYRYWATRLAAADWLPSLEHLLDNDRLSAGSYGETHAPEEGKLSYLVAEASAATLVEFLVRRWGRSLFLSRYSTWSPAGEELAELERAWRDDLLASAPSFKEKVGKHRELFPEPARHQRGVNFTDEALQVSGGYLSPAADRSLQYLSSLKVNAVALVPFTYTPHRDQPISFAWPSRPEQETDEGLIHSALLARRLGLTVLLKPQIWGVWPGNLAMEGEQEWERFFRSYRRWIRHYALLAEMYGIPILSVGVELAEATRRQEGRFRELIRDLRRLYSGKLVYCANWGDEFERIPFWDELDYMGIDFYYPLSDQTDPTDEELLQGARQALERIRLVQLRFRKPLLLTEVGYPSTPRGWIRPWESRRQDPPALEDQARCLRVLCRALQEQDWISGLYWWKWPTSLGAGGPRDRSHILRGKPAEEAMARCFQTLF